MKIYIVSNSIPGTYFTIRFVIIFAQNFITNIVIGAHDGFATYAAFVRAAL